MVIRPLDQGIEIVFCQRERDTGAAPPGGRQARGLSVDVRVGILQPGFRGSQPDPTDGQLPLPVALCTGEATAGENANAFITRNIRRTCGKGSMAAWADEVVHLNA